MTHLGTAPDPGRDVVSGRVLLLKPGDTLIIAGAGAGAVDDWQNDDPMRDAVTCLKDRLNLAAVWVFDADIDIAKAHIATRLKPEEAQ